ncbi:MAG: YdeI/OmpD-associated family protein [Flavobacteriales bacterium]|nr:YdeI/OmpD-associated family protein [Flavobacteriales bacterium]
MASSTALPTRAFKTAKSFETWLEKNQESAGGLWLKLFKKDSGKKTISYAEALDVALCYGWIDGQKKALDAEAWLQKFCPRKASSVWSKVNIGHVERLIKEGRMRPSGARAIEKAKADGSWERAYDPPSRMTVPDDLLKALRKNKQAEKHFKGLNKTDRFIIGFRLQTAKKQETREKRMKEIIEKLVRGEKFR